METQPFQSIKEIKEFLANSGVADRKDRKADLQKVAPLFHTNLGEIMEKLQELDKRNTYYHYNHKLVVDTYYDYNKNNNYGQKPLKNSDVCSVQPIDDLILVYSLVIQDFRIAVATKKTNIEKHKIEKNDYLTPEYLKTIRLNLLFPQKQSFRVTKESLFEQQKDKEFKYVISSCSTDYHKRYKFFGDQDAWSLFVSRDYDGLEHMALFGSERLTKAVWQIVEENVEKKQAKQTNIILKDIKYRKMVLKRFCAEAEMIKEDLKFEEELAESNPEDKQLRAGIRKRFADEIKEKEEYKDQEKALIAHLHGEVKELKTKDAKQNLGLILH